MILEAAEVMKACKALLYLPCCLIRVGNGTARQTHACLRRSHRLDQRFGGATTLSAIAQALGIPALTTELGGGASLSRAGETLARDGVLRVLKHLGILPDAIVEPAGPTRSIGSMAGKPSPMRRSEGYSSLP